MSAPESEYTPTTDEVLEAWHDEMFPNASDASFYRWLADHEDATRIAALEEVEATWVDWLIAIGYPFDFSFDAKPPVDVRRLGLAWKKKDDWSDVSDEEAIACVREESGLPEFRATQEGTP